MPTKSVVKKKAAARKSRAVAYTPGVQPGPHYPYFERVTSNRYRLKEEVSRTFYAIACLLADEHDDTRRGLTTSMPDDFARMALRAEYHRKAAAALRMMADRLMKSFTLNAMIRAERYAMEEWYAARAKFNRLPISKREEPGTPSEPGTDQ